MLPRAALRVARPRLAPIPRLPTRVKAPQLRSYAKGDKPHRAPKKSSPFEDNSNISPEAQAYSSKLKSEFSPADAAKLLRSQYLNTKTNSAQTPKSSSEQSTQEESKTSGPNVINSTEGNEVDEKATSRPLPDLRQGIPSTFESEFGKQDFSQQTSSRESQPDESERFDYPEEGAKQKSTSGSGGRGGELPKSAYETSTDRRRNQYMDYSVVICLLLGIGGAVYYGRNWETEEEERAHPEAPSGWNFGHFWKRINARWSNQLSYYTEPTFPKLLPDMDPAPPYTLVLSLNDLLVHSEWTREHGWRTAKRPGLDYFLRYLCQYYEIVVFTDLPSTSADLIIKKLDPLRMVIAWPLYREATRYENGEYVKDLSYLNRDMSKVILVDTKKSHAKHQPDNAIILPPWKGTPNDKGLVNLIPFLEYLAAMGIPDVRQAIKSFEGADIPEEFARREAIAREKFNKQLAEERAKRPKHSAASWLMSSLGLKPQGAMTLDGVSLSEGFEQGKMLSDQARERGQRQYELMEKEIRENGAKWLKEMEEAEKKMQEEWMKDMKSNLSLNGVFGGEQPSQAPVEKK